MAFQLWEFPGGTYGEGVSMRDAVYNAVGAALVKDRCQMYDLDVGSYDLTVPDLVDRFSQRHGITVLSGALALCYSLPAYPLERFDNDPRDLFGLEVLLLPQEGGYMPVLHGIWRDEQLAVAVVYRVVRHVESTPTWTEWLAAH